MQSGSQWKKLTHRILSLEEKKTERGKRGKMLWVSCGNTGLEIISISSGFIHVFLYIMIALCVCM